MWQPVESATVRRGPLGVHLLAPGRLSDRIAVDVEIDCYESVPRIEIAHRFAFDSASVGTFFDDGSKLLLHWPLSVIESATHDIPFGAVNAAHDQSIFPTNWLDIRAGDAGLLLMHDGTPRHWIANRDVVRLLGWGEDTDAIGNRLGNSRWLKRFDQRLRGVHVVRSAVEVHPLTWGPDDVIAAARSFSCGPFAFSVEDRGHGTLPLDLTLVALSAAGPHATSVTPGEDQVTLRVHGGPRGTPSTGPSAPGLNGLTYRSLKGRRLKRLRPWQIAHMELAQRDIVS
jgi:hypothetical protein